MPNENLERLAAAARLLGPILSELVFVGGSTAGLLITDDGAGEPRPTVDVDAITRARNYAEYTSLGQRLRRLGFHEDMREGAPACRWVHGEVVLDIMPLEERILGFSNRWYARAIETAVRHRLPNGLEIRMVTAPLFIATKLEAFKGRGRNDLRGSHDLADLIALVDGRESLVEEVRAESPELRRYIRTEIRRLLAKPAFIDALPEYQLPDAVSQARVRVVLERLENLAAL